MNVPNRPTVPTAFQGLHWQVTDDGSRTLWDAELEETYHSVCGAVAESLSVYLQNSGVHERLLTREACSVLEYGFGTGTAFLLTAADAVLCGARLRYRALESNLLPASIFTELQFTEHGLPEIYRTEFGELLPVAQRVLEQLVAWRSALPSIVTPGKYACSLSADVALDLVVGDAVDYVAGPADSFDAVYFDPFSPATCPRLWTAAVFQNVFNLLRSGGALTSYCVKGSVRRDLEAIGFEVIRLPGPVGGKREVMRAVKPNAKPIARNA